MSSTRQALYERQRSWASSRNIQVDVDGYTLTLDDNLFKPLSTATHREYSVGKGSELGDEQHRGKMQALHSSSALVCNVFEYWRNRSFDPLTAALGVERNLSELHFERIYPIFPNRMPPHLDVVLFGTNVKPVAIESKFIEPYESQKETLQAAYSGLWAKYNLLVCEDFARAIHEERVKFVYLGAAQLLKHILGLCSEHGNGFTLLYLWYDYPSVEATAHRAEIELFKQQLDSDLDFRVMTYQELFQRLKSHDGIDSAYLSYLEQRYFMA